MARIRSIKPEFWTDRSLARRLSRDARMLYVGMWNLADEHGRLNGDAYYIKGQIFPYDDDLTPGAIDNLIDELDDAGKVVRYADSGDPYLFLPRLDRHQRLESDKVPSKLPAPPSAPDIPSPPGPKTVRPQVEASTTSREDLSESRANSSAPRADESALSYVAGSMEHVAGSMEHVPPRADTFQPPLLALVGAEPLAALAEPEPTFDDFWKPWPRKVSKPPAAKAWAKAIEKATPAVIVEACREYAERCAQVNKETNFIPHPATWLNEERWNDDLDAAMPLPAARATPPRESTTDRAVASGDDALAEFRRITGRRGA